MADQTTDADPTIIGATITEIRPLTRTELDARYWSPSRHTTPLALVLSTGALIIPMSDPEGNDAGALALATPDGVEYRLALTPV